MSGLVATSRVANVHKYKNRGFDAYEFYRLTMMNLMARLGLERFDSFYDAA